jgi:hypothetical protein
VGYIFNRHYSKSTSACTAVDISADICMWLHICCHFVLLCQVHFVGYSPNPHYSRATALCTADADDVSADICMWMHTCCLCVCCHVDFVAKSPISTAGPLQYALLVLLVSGLISAHGCTFAVIVFAARLTLWATFPTRTTAKPLQHPLLLLLLISSCLLSWCLLSG